MSLKKFTLFKFMMVFSAVFFLSLEVDAQQRTKSSNPSTTTSVDNTTLSVPNSLTFTGGSSVGTSNFNQGCRVTDVNVRIRWAKTDGSCTSPANGPSVHTETGFAVRSPNGTEISLFNPGTYTGNATMSLITQTFDDNYTTLPGGATPTGGNYRPEQSLAGFNGESGIGTWSLRATDNANLDPLCIDWWEITVTTTTDNTVPTALCKSITKVLNSSGVASITAGEIDNGSSDMCGLASGMTVSPSTFDCGDIGSNNVTLTVTDIYGNTSSCTGTVTIQDNSAPSITCAANVTGTTDNGSCMTNASNITLTAPSAVDNCNVTFTNNAPASYPIGETTVTWTGTDQGGNTAQCTQKVTISDTEPPTISCPGPITLNTSSGFCSAIGGSIGFATGNDNCGSPTITHDIPAAFPLGPTTVTWTATDAAGQMNSCTRTITVIDNEAPTITCPPTVNTTANFSGCSAAFVPLGTPTTSDNCGVMSVVADNTGPFPVGTTTVTWTVTDDNNNTAQCTQDVVVTSDASAAATTTPEVCGLDGEIDLTVTSGSFVTGVTWSNGETVQDITGLAAGDYTVTVYNSNGCTASETFTVGTAPDTEAPMITSCTATINVNADAPGCMTATGVTLVPPTATDNCNVASITNNSTGTYFVGPNLVIWTVTDDAGNSTPCYQNVLVTGNNTFLSASTTDESCGSSNGEIDLSVAGDPAASILWSNGDTSEDITGLAAGDYTVTATNGAGCETTGTYTVSALGSGSGGGIASTSSCGTCSITDGNSVSFTNPSGEYLVDITDIASGTDLSGVNVCVDIAGGAGTCNGTPFLQRTWTIDVTNNEGADVTFYCTDAEMNDLLANTSGAYPDVATMAADLVITGMDGMGEACNDNTSVSLYSATVVANTPEPGVWAISVTTTGFSTFYLHPAPVPLPVELNLFTGWNRDKINVLKWETVSEENSSYFEIQKSASGEEFERIGSVAAAGNSVDAIVYNFEDNDPFSGKNYYRLKVVDLDGSYKYSDIILINTEGKASVKGFPNPFTNNISLQLISPASGTAQISLYDVSGKQVIYVEREVEMGASSQGLKLNKLAEGTYIVKILLPGTEDYLSTKIIKNNK